MAAMEQLCGFHVKGFIAIVKRLVARVWCGPGIRCLLHTGIGTEEYLTERKHFKINIVTLAAYSDKDKTTLEEVGTDVEMTLNKSMEDETCLNKYRGKTKERATVVMALMRRDETKLLRQVKRFIKKHKSLAKQVLTTDLEGWTPIHACAMRCSKTLIKAFLEAGIDINITMGQPEGLPNNCSLLHMAALRGDLKIMELLVSRGADVNAYDSYDNTPVIYAAKRRHRRVLRFLEEHGAKMNGVELPAKNDHSVDCITPQPSSAKFCFFW